MYWTTAAIYVLLFFFILICVLMCFVVLMQRSKQEGLGAAFGGGFTESVWGAQTSQVLVKATVWLAALFFIFSILLARLYTYQAALKKEPSAFQQQLLHPTTPAGASTKPVSAPGNPNPVSPLQAVVPTATPMQNSVPALSLTNGAPDQPEPAPAK
jgi:preprotein translocase subunit SecG